MTKKDNEPMLEETSDEVLLEETSSTEAMLEKVSDSEVLLEEDSSESVLLEEDSGVSLEETSSAVQQSMSQPTTNTQATSSAPAPQQKTSFFNRLLGSLFGTSSSQSASADECYSNGAALAQTNINEAVKWFERGAKLGHRGCENELAVYYYTKNQKKKALSYAQNAMDYGFLDSAFILGMNYFERALKTENEDDFINAFSHISAALNPPKNTPKDHLLSEGLAPQAKGLLGFCYMGMPGISANTAKAKSLLNEAIAGGSAEAKLWYDQFKQAGIL